MANLFNANNDGVDGVYTATIGGDMLLTVGSDHNSYASTSIDSTGMQTTKTVVTESGGNVNFDSGMTKCEEVDTSHLFQTGNCKIHSGNTIWFTSGSGGIVLDTTGNVKINAGGGMAAITSGVTIDFSAKNTIQFTAPEGIRFSTNNLQMDTKGMNFGGNLDVNKNLKVNGSAFVQGELYVTHITAERQKMLTDEDGAVSGFINPLQSYALVNGSSLYSQLLEIVGKEMVPPPTPGPGMLDAVIDLGVVEANPAFVSALAACSASPYAAPAAPAIAALASIISGPSMVKLGFPSGVHLVSNQAMTQDFASASAMTALESVVGGNILDGTMSDFAGASHQHAYYIPACNMVEGTDEVWKQAQVCNKDEPGAAKPMQLMDMSPGEAVKSILATAAKKALECSTIVKTLRAKVGI